ncbi:MAG TPA: DUF72 domain-containing protein [Polyangia bacterium]|nr:DUF72 domain-containing protein [Polyangia bacterium]
MEPPAAQRPLFELPARGLAAAPPSPEHQALAARLPAAVRFGTMSWTFPGWIGKVYAAGAPKTRLADRGLPAYAAHPLLRAVEVDRTYYEAPAADFFRGLADQVPADFQFLAKAHEACTVFRFPLHARYGKRRGEVNERFLDAGYAAEAVVGPYVEGLGAKAGPLLFQFPPQPLDVPPEKFAERLHAFLAGLPRGPAYAVELRNAELLTPAYGAALLDAGALHCHNAWSFMPPVMRQARLIPPGARRPLVIRWLLRPGDTYEAAGARTEPFDRLREADPESRAGIATLAVKAHQHGVPVVVLVNNTAEGCAPDSIALLAAEIAERIASAPAGG